MKTITEQYRGNIPLDTKYKIENVLYKNKDDLCFCTCENCGHIISNVYVIKGENGKIYNVGSECVIPLTNDALDLKEWKIIVSGEKRFMKHILTECKTVIWSDKHNTAWTYIKDIKEWSSFWKYRFSRKKWQSFILKNNINVIVDNR
jgi:hypothetical protein